MIAVVVVAAVTFNLERVTDLPRRHVDIVTLVKDAPGVRVGTDVWAEGVKVGRVQAVHITKHNDSAYVALDVRLQSQARDIVTAGSDVRAARRRLIGEPVVRLYAGSPGDPPLQRGDTLIGRPRIQPEDLLAMSERLPTALDSLFATGATVRSDVERGAPQLQRLNRQLAVTRATVTEFSEALEAGSVGRMLDPETGLAAHMTALRARFHELGDATARLAERLTADGDDALAPRLDALSQRIGQVDEAVTRLQIRIDQGEGIVGRAQRDTALQVAVRGVQLQIDSLMAEAQSIATRMLLP